MARNYKKIRLILFNFSQHENNLNFIENKNFLAQ